MMAMRATKMRNLDNNRIEFKHKLDYLKFSVDPEHLLNSLGFKISNETEKELRAPCLIHRGDNKTSFRFNKDYKSWVCFSHKCHKTYGNDVISLIMAVTGRTFNEAVSYLQSLVGDVSTNIQMALEYERRKERKHFIDMYSSNIEKPEIVSEDKLRLYRPFRSDSFLRDGYSDETLDFFEVAGGYTDSFGYIRDIIPIRDDAGELVAYSMRDTRRDVTDTDYKYILTKGFIKDKVLYNLHNAKQHLASKNSTLIVVEGFKSVWRMHDLGIHNVVAVMGSELLPGQVNLLFTHAVENIVVMFDGDTAGISGALKARDTVQGKLGCYPIFILEEGKDPSDLDDDQIYNYLRGYIE